MEAGNTVDSIKPVSIFEKVKDFAEKEVEKIENVFNTVKEIPAEVEQHLADALKEAESTPSIVASDLKAETVTVEAAILTPIDSRLTALESHVVESIGSRLAKFEADFKALEERIANFNARSGQKL